ncbi:acetate uptake transporter [Curtobacterium luteum]|uniref:acetate uptake transporter n=1 Tax=Curtobacterium luteum TaxID=33881 RepID=UPI003817BADF
MSNVTAQKLKPRSPMSRHHPTLKGFADPAALGLGAFAVSTFLLSFANAGIVPAAAPAVLGVALFYGGIAQVISGLWEFVRGNTFGAAAFVSYGSFWLAYWWMQTNPELAKEIGGSGFGMYMITWTIFTGLLTVITTRINMMLFLLYATATVTFLTLGLSAFTGEAWLQHVGGWFGLASSAAAWYGFFAAMLNSTLERVVLPLGIVGNP